MKTLAKNESDGLEATSWPYSPTMQELGLGPVGTAVCLDNMFAAVFLHFLARSETLSRLYHWACEYLY